MHALVTGAGGFLGRYLVEQLVAQGDRVRALCRRGNQELGRLGVEVVVCDLRDSRSVVAQCEGIDAVFHVAGVSGIWGGWPHYY
ncbi:MAG TPA: NAD-dependent epimerase/dehydratase family protein, partial [Pirellulales bacterium]